MKLTESIFKQVIAKLQEQQDNDNNRAKLLSDIYGADIDPTDNSKVVEAVFLMFNDIFSIDQMAEISFFVYDQDFGRKANRTIDDLWNDLIKMIEVEYFYVKPKEDE
jgi:hypothetical protein|tara:strand:+ start:30193 stop:30513 length:321 start_codon:yes stop_codon:yes gene_type:complete